MPSEFSPDVKFEIGHVLFIDIVGYSKLRIKEQSEQLQTLKEIMRGTEQFRLAEAEGKLLRLPTGDGGALVFRTSPEAAAMCAMEISRQLKSHPQLAVRMGIHSGPVNEITDLNEQANIAGVGINMAQRVMDCGDANHILLSRHVTDDLEQYEQWGPLLHELGTCEVKHGVRVDIINLHSDDVGNPQLPKKFQALKKHRSRVRWAEAAIALFVLAAIVSAFLFVMRRPVRPALSVADKSIAVLPFENLSSDKENAYFAEGIQDEILTKLASVADLKVISRTSTAKYRSKPEDLKTVSQQLGVANVVEGTVQRAVDKVRVNVQLIDARTDSHLWAKTYDRDIKDVFAVESEVSQEIADALQAKLSPNESNILAAAPTQNTEAYDLFLKGEFEEREAESSLNPEPFDRAAAYYQQALDRDPNFALAAARLAESRILRQWFLNRLAANDPDVGEIKRLVDRALTLEPNEAEAHIALGSFYYYVKLQYEDALQEFRRALELQPNNNNAAQLSGYVHRRQGQWKLALSQLTQSEERDPRSGTLVANIGAAYLFLRMWEEAKRYGLRSLALEPHNVVGMRPLVASYLNQSGDIKGAKRALATFPPDVILINKSVIGEVTAVIGEGTYVHVIERDFASALKDWEVDKTSPDDRRMQLAARVTIRLLAADNANEQAEIESANSSLQARLRERPADRNAMVQLAWVSLGQKHNADALRFAREAVKLLPIEEDAVGGVLFLSGLAQIEARAGETNEAVKTLQRLLSIPAGFNVSIQRLKIDPVWDPIRNDPGFQKLLVGKELIGPNK